MEAGVRPTLIAVLVLCGSRFGVARWLEISDRVEPPDLHGSDRKLYESAQASVSTHPHTTFMVSITTSELHLVTHNPSPSFLVDFGQKVQQFDPLQLFNISGTNRTDVVYELNNGKVFINTRVANALLPCAVRLSVDPGVTKTPEGNPNGAAVLEITYQPRNVGVDYLALGMGTAMTVVASGWVSAGVMSGLLAPLAPAGVMGHGLLGLILCAQKLYFFSRLAVFALPENFVQLGAAFSWSTASIGSPVDRLVRSAPQFSSSAVAFQPELLRMTQQGAYIDAQTLPLNNSAVVSALLSEAQNPDFVSPLIVEPYLVPPSPPPPPQVKTFEPPPGPPPPPIIASLPPPPPAFPPPPVPRLLPPVAVPPVRSAPPPALPPPQPPPASPPPPPPASAFAGSTRGPDAPAEVAFSPPPVYAPSPPPMPPFDASPPPVPPFDAGPPPPIAFSPPSVPVFDYSPPAVPVPVVSPPPPAASPPPPPPPPSPSGFGNFQVVPADSNRSPYGIPATLSPPPPPAPATPTATYAPVNLQGTPGSSLAGLLTSLGVPRGPSPPPSTPAGRRRLSEPTNDPPKTSTRRRLDQEPVDVANSIQFVATSTGVEALTSNGTGNEWALFGPLALAAAKQMQGSTGNARANLSLHISRLLFYGGCLLFILVLWRLVQACICCLGKRGLHPNFMTFPRLELFFLMIALPAVADASSALFAGSVEAVVLGSALLLGLVVLSLAFFFISVWVWLTSSECKRAALIALPHKPSSPSSRVVLSLRWLLRVYSGDCSFRCQWLDLEAPHSSLLSGWGLLFEDNFGARHELQDATYEPTYPSSKPQRGHAVRIIPSSGWGFPRSSTLQAFATLFSTTKVVIIGVCIAGLATIRPATQLGLLLAVCSVHLAYLRLLVPLRLQTDQACEVTAALADIATVTCGFLLLAERTANFRCTIGWIMIAIQLAAIIAYLVGMVVRTAYIISNAAWPYGFLWKEASGSQKFANVVFAVLYRLRKNPQRLRAKFASLWLKNMRKQKKTRSSSNAVNALPQKGKVTNMQEPSSLVAPQTAQKSGMLQISRASTVANPRSSFVPHWQQPAMQSPAAGMRRSSSVGAVGLPPKSPGLRASGFERDNPLKGLECIKRGSKLRQSHSLPNPASLRPHQLPAGSSTPSQNDAVGVEMGSSNPLAASRSESLRKWQTLANELEQMCNHSAASFLDIV